MVGIWQSHSSIFLYVAGAATLAGYGIPLLIAPLTWGRWFRWDTQRASPLTVFLGRSLGVLLCVVGASAFRVAALPRAQPFFFELLIWILLGTLVLHIYGAITRAQPWTETVEITLWGVLILATLAFCPTG
jgi:hypothetical protein